MSFLLAGVANKLIFLRLPNDFDNTFIKYEWFFLYSLLYYILSDQATPLILTQIIFKIEMHLHSYIAPILDLLKVLQLASSSIHF